MSNENNIFLGMYPWSKIEPGTSSSITPSEVQEMIDNSLKSYAKAEDLEDIAEDLVHVKETADKAVTDINSHVTHKGAPYDLGHVMSSVDYRGESMEVALIDGFGQIRYNAGLSKDDVTKQISVALTPYMNETETEEFIDSKMSNYVTNIAFGVHAQQEAGRSYGHVRAYPAKGDENVSVTITDEGYLVAKVDAGGDVNLPFYNVADNPTIMAVEGYDNTREIQYVMDTLFSRGGGTMYFPEGVYEITALEMRPKVSIVGTGMGSTVFRCTDVPRGYKGVFSFPANTTCATFKNFTIDGNNKGISGIYFAPTGYMGDIGRDEVGHLAERIIADEFGIKTPPRGTRIPHKNMFFENICICYCGDGSMGSMYENEDTYYGIRIRDDREQFLLPDDDNGYGCYNLDFNHIWIYGCDNGMVTFNTDSAFNDSYIECSRWGGWFIGGGNCKFTNIKAIWNGVAYRQQPQADCPAVAINNGTGQHTLCNFELQDNLGGVDMRVQGDCHSITNLVCDANQYDMHTVSKLQVFGRGHYISARLASYSGARAETGILGECYDSIMFITGSSRCAMTFDSELTVQEGFVQSYHY